MTLPTFEKHCQMTPAMEKQADEALDVLLRHRRGNPITGEEFAREMGWRKANGRGEDSMTRAMVSYLRTERFAPIASEGTGYFMASKPEELNVTIEHLRARAAKISVVAHALSRAQTDMTQAQSSLFPNKDWRLFV